LEGNLTEIVLSQRFVSRAVVDGAFEDGLSVVVLTGLVVFDTIFITLALSTGSESTGNKQ
jgi:hypothetical protein